MSNRGVESLNRDCLSSEVKNAVDCPSLMVAHDHEYRFPTRTMQRISFSPMQTVLVTVAAKKILAVHVIVAAKKKSALTTNHLSIMGRIDYSTQNSCLWSWSPLISQTCTKDPRVSDPRVADPGFAGLGVVLLELECSQTGPK